MSNDSNQCNGSVIASFGRHCVVQADDGGARVHCKIRRKAGKPVCGDRVRFAGAPDDGVIEAVGRRNNYFPRADRQGRQQIVAANLDRIVVVVASQPKPTRDLINRYLVACEAISIPAVLCINKRDLLDSDSYDAWEQRLSFYRELGYPALFTSAKDDHGLDNLKALLREGVSVLVGQSGVGKSSLVNALVPDLELKTQSISDATGKGRHTTTASTLYELEDGGAIVDSPGVWEYGIWRMEAAEVAQGFREFRDLIEDCRFSNCSHTHEPGCGVSAAAERSDIQTERLDSYRRIMAAMVSGQYG